MKQWNGMKAALASRDLIILWEKPGGCSCSGSTVSSRTDAGSIFLLCLPWALLSTFNLVPLCLQNDLHCIVASQVCKKVMDIEEFFFNGKENNYLKLQRKLPLQVSLDEDELLDHPSWQDRLWKHISSRGGLDSCDWLTLIRLYLGIDILSHWAESVNSGGGGKGHACFIFFPSNSVPVQYELRTLEKLFFSLDCAVASWILKWHSVWSQKCYIPICQWKFQNCMKAFFLHASSEEI